MHYCHRVTYSIRRIPRVTALLLLSIFTVISSAAEPAATRQFSIRAQPLDVALLEFSEQADLQILISASLLTGLHSNEVIGRYVPMEALCLLIAGTGLKARVVGNDTVALSRAGAATPLTAIIAVPFPLFPPISSK